MIKRILIEIFKKFLSRKVEKPVIEPRFVISAAELTRELTDMGIESIGRRLDSEYYFTTLENWWQMFRYIYLTQDLPKYALDKEKKWNRDCDFFALWLKVMCEAHFGMNGIAYITGNMPRGVHGFDMFKTDEGYRLKEPNPAFGLPEEEPFTINDQYGYTPIEAFL